MKQTDFTKVLLQNQKYYLEAQTKNVEVLTEMKSALVSLNDTNILHIGKEDARYEILDRLATAVEVRSKVMNLVFLLLAGAVIILAGAEKIFQFIKL